MADSRVHHHRHHDHHSPSSVTIPLAISHQYDCAGVAVDPLVLLLGGYTPDTQDTYLKAVNRFADWCESSGVILDVRSWVHLDYHLSRYMVHLWYGGYGKAAASNTFYGLDMLLPGIRYKMPMSSPQCVASIVCGHHRRTRQCLIPSLSLSLHGSPLIIANMDLQWQWQWYYHLIAIYAPVNYLV